MTAVSSSSDQVSTTSVHNTRFALPPVLPTSPLHNNSTEKTENLAPGTSDLKNKHCNNMKKFVLPVVVSTTSLKPVTFSPNLSPPTPTTHKAGEGEDTIANHYHNTITSASSSSSSTLVTTTTTTSSTSLSSRTTSSTSTSKAHKFVSYTHPQLLTVSSPGSGSNPTSPPQKAKRGKKVIPLSEEQLRTHYIYPQPEAARRLGVSLSTLKRRFYELHSGKRWPYNDIKNTIKKRRLRYIMNEKSKPEKFLDQYTIFALNKAFISCTNEVIPSSDGNPVAVSMSDE